MVGAAILGGLNFAGGVLDVISGFKSSRQAREQRRYFQQMYDIIDQRYQKQRAIQVRSNYLEQGQFQQNIINSGVDTSQGASLSYETGKQNLVQVQNEQLQQMDYEHQLQMMGLDQQIRNAKNLESNYRIAAITKAVSFGVNAGLGVANFGMGAMDAFNNLKQQGLQGAMRSQNGTGFNY